MEDAERIALSIGILARDLEVRYNKRVILMQTPDHVSRTLLPDTVLNTYLNDITEWLADGWEHSIARLRSSRPSARNSADESNVALRVKATARSRKKKPLDDA